MSEFRIGLLFLICLIGVLIIYGTIRRAIKKRRSTTQRQTSSIHCHHCGSPMLESDVFCNNCQTITPKVQEMLDRNPDKKPDFYHTIDNGYKLRCPHCKLVYRSAKDIFPPDRYSSPIKYCANCHNYFLDYAYTEWSVASFSIKLLDFFPILYLIVYFIIFQFIVSFAINGDWFIVPDLSLLLLALISIHSAFVFAQNKIIYRKLFHESHMRLKHNLDYPKILITMGYGKIMSKEYHHLSKEPILSRKDKLKELLKDAFTFD